MLRYPFLSYCLIILMTSLNVQAQDLVSFEFLKEESKQFFIDQGVPAEYDIEYYKITYTTPDVNEVQDTASGLLILPKDGFKQFPMLTYMHGTVADRNQGMSNLAAADVQLAETYASFGFVTVAPDYLGMNEARGFHPYVHAKTEASAGRDMMRAVRSSITSQFNRYLNGRTFITGYSQGGHAAMALHRELEQNNAGEFDIIMNLPMSGPYSISEKMIEFSLGDNEYFFVAYLPNVALSYKTAYPDLLQDIELEDIFKADYISDIVEFRNGSIDLLQLNQRLINILVANHGSSIPKFMLRDDIVDALFNDPDHPLSMALADNDVYDWSPEAWLRMYYCEGDDQVSFQNTILAEEVMKNNGGVKIEKWSIGSDLNHTECVTPAVQEALTILFLLRGITTSTTQLIDSEKIELSPNPANDILEINLDKTLSLQHTKVILLDYNGHAVIEQKINHTLTRISVEQLPKGLYILEVISPTYRGIKKIVKQ